MTATETVSQARQRLGLIGVWLQGNTIRSGTPDIRRRQIARIESLGYRSLWAGEIPGSNDVFVQLATLLAGTDQLVAGSGIANVWSRPAVTAYAATEALTDAYPDRFVLGLGVGHPVQARSLGEDFGKPLGTMRRYLDELATPATTSQYSPEATGPATPTVLGAVGPRMLELAAERVDGAHSFAQPVASTVVARKILGPDKLLIPGLTVAFDPDPAVAKRTAREFKERGRALGGDVAESPYARNLLRLGYTVEDVTEVTDRLVDDTTAHGDEAAIVARVREHVAAGADHVLIHPLAADLTTAVHILERLAPALLEVEPNLVTG